MRQFHATAVEVYTEEGILTIHFDDEADQYIQLQAPEVDDPVEYEEGYGNVYVEMDDQLYSGFNCFSYAELTRNRFRLVFTRDEAFIRVGEVVVTFDLDDVAFGDLRRGLTLAFRAFANFRVDDA